MKLWMSGHTGYRRGSEIEVAGDYNSPLFLTQSGAALWAAATPIERVALYLVRPEEVLVEDAACVEQGYVLHTDHAKVDAIFPMSLRSRRQLMPLLNSIGIKATIPLVYDQRLMTLVHQLDQQPTFYRHLTEL